VRLQLHALAHNLGNFLRTLTKEKLIKIGAVIWNAALCVPATSTTPTAGRASCTNPLSMDFFQCNFPAAVVIIH
jgi:hypothetical protein